MSHDLFIEKGSDLGFSCWGVENFLEELAF